MGEYVLYELGCDLWQSVIIRSTRLDADTIGVAVVEETKVIFISCKIRVCDASCRLRTRPCRIECCRVLDKAYL